MRGSSGGNCQHRGAFDSVQGTVITEKKVMKIAENNLSLAFRRTSSDRLLEYEQES